MEGLEWTSGRLEGRTSKSSFFSLVGRSDIAVVARRGCWSTLDPWRVSVEWVLSEQSRRGDYRGRTVVVAALWCQWGVSDGGGAVSVMSGGPLMVLWRGWDGQAGALRDAGAKIHFFLSNCGF